MPRKLPPIVGPKPLPVGQRPKCMYCGAELRPEFRELEHSIRVDEPSRRGTIGVRMARYFTGEYGHRSAFCSGTHAQSFAFHVPIVKRRSDEYPKLKAPELKESWKRSAEAFVQGGGYGWDFQLSDALIHPRTPGDK